MNKFLFLTAVGAFFSASAFANIYRVNSSLTTSPTQKIYNSLQEANDATAVMNGDTLMVEGSPVEYTSVTITKRLILIGPGYFLTANPQTQASPLQAVVRNITLEETASGTVLTGLTFSNNSSSYAPYVKTGNVIVMRCYMPWPINIIGDLNNIQVLQNYFVSGAIYIGSSSYSFSQVALKNNYVGSQLVLTSTDTDQRIFSAVENNIFNGNVSFITSTFRSNIIIPTTATATIASNNIQNNLVSNAQLPSTNGNQTYVAANLFVGATGNSTDGQYQLKANSPYLTAGYGGTAPGIFGGSQSYVLSGIPAVPAIYEFTADGFANKQTGLPINIKVKANQ